jgi:hypothetical protein
MLDGAVDPSEAEGLLHGIVVGKALFSGFFHRKNEPYHL